MANRFCTKVQRHFDGEKNTSFNKWAYICKEINLTYILQYMQYMQSKLILDLNVISKIQYFIENTREYLSNLVLDCLLIPEIILNQDRALSATLLRSYYWETAFALCSPWLCDQVFRAPDLHLLKRLARHYRWLAFYDYRC